MTNESISGFLNSIAEAKRAFDAEPQYQKQISELERDKQRLGETVAQRELRIHNLKQDNDELLGKLRSVEAERDDAGFRALEETDKVSSLLVVVHSIINDALKAVSAVEGYEQIVVNKNEHQGNLNSIRLLEDANEELKEELQRLKNEMALAQEQLTRPFASATSSSSGDTTGRWSPDTVHIVDEATGYAKPYEGQSEVDPTSERPVGLQEPTQVAAGEGQSDGPFASKSTTGNIPEPAIALSTSAETETSAASSASPTPPERNRDRSTFFKGRRYYDVTYFVPLHQWLNEGGTEADYHWRPATTAFSNASQRSS